jgi:hypothetical protein
MSIDLIKTSGTSPPALYHHTYSLSLPQIMRDGFLKPLNSEAVRTGDAASDAAPEYVHATTNPEGDSTSTLAYLLRSNPELDHIRVRFTLHAEDFKPWRETVEAEPRYPRKLIDALILSAQRLGVSPYSWFVSESEVPLQRVKAIHFKNKRDREWREVDHPWRFVVESYASQSLGFEFGSGKTPDTNFFEWSASFETEDGRVGKRAMYRTLARDTYQALFANDWQPPPEPPQDADPYIYRTYELRTASLPLGIVEKLDAAFPLTRYSGEVDEVPEVTSPALAIFADPSDLMAKVASEFKPKSAPLPATNNAKRMTTNVRYVITSDTFRRYPAEEIETEKAELIAADMWNLPSDEPYTIRLGFYDLAEFLERFGDSDDVVASLRERYSTRDSQEVWLDYDMRGDKRICTSVVYRNQKPGNIDKQLWIDTPISQFAGGDSSLLDLESRQAWWEKGNWFCERFTVTRAGTQFISNGLLEILVLALMDTSVVQERTPKPILPKKSAFLLGGRLYNKEQDVQEVTIRCPGYYRTSNGERGEATGRRVKMHRRRGHPRVLHRGEPEQRTIYIQPMWINKIEGVEPPPVVYTVRAS